jgi:hypothetical protein
MRNLSQISNVNSRPLLMITPICVAIVCAFVSTESIAQSCSSPGFLSGPFDPPIVVNATTCGQPALLHPLCGEAPLAAPAAAFQLSVGSPLVGTITVQPHADFDIVVALQNGSCTATGDCPRLVDFGGQGEAETIDLRGIAEGEYSLVVVGAAGLSCGTFTVTVRAQNLVYYDGFEQ